MNATEVYKAYLHAVTNRMAGTMPTCSNIEEELAATALGTKNGLAMLSDPTRNILTKPEVLAAVSKMCDVAPYFQVVLVSAGQRKIDVIKAIREITGLQLKPAKDLVDSPPSSIKSRVTRAEAESIQKLIAAAGGLVGIRGIHGEDCAAERTPDCIPPPGPCNCAAGTRDV